MTSSTEERRAASSPPRGTSKGTCASARVRLARTIRWAMVGSGTRKARAISSVERTGWQETNTRRRRSSPMSSSNAPSKSVTAISCCAWSSRPSSSCLRSSRLFRRKASIARCFAVAMSQAPGLSGMPDSGHCWSAATRASCASSSARPTSRTIRARPAMILADSILQTASMAVCVLVAVTATHHTIFNPLVQAPGARRLLLRGHPYARALLCIGVEVLRREDLANFGLTLPAGPVFLVKFHEVRRRFDRLFFRLQLKDRISADDFLGLGERPVGPSQLPSRNPHARAHRRRGEPAGCDHRSSFVRLFAELCNGVHEFFGRNALVLSGLDQHHKSHRDTSPVCFCFPVRSWIRTSSTGTAILALL